MTEIAKQPAETMLPVHEQVYRRVRDLLLFGELPPGAPVTIQGLTEGLDVGMTPVREAIRRLTAEGALSFQGNRRVSVPVLDAGAISELIHARVAIEPELTRRACLVATSGDIAALAAIDDRLDLAISQGDVRGYLEQNYRFHLHLYGLAQAPILQELAEGLWLRFGPSLRVVCGRYGTQNLPDQHKAILTAMAQGDASAAAKAMEEDVRQGIAQILETLA
ncbi:GntR family transcriptional regulator [Marinovum sp. 2_MG-2023]|uniref:GntR family transcriptional regulator n=1 Tax=unclassified Marinovum TaxID=2647166 RepID=UPI0026E19501|nr:MULTISPECIES: GntR family transcriptional regulator [unclassified Marinovum]MDO6730188.1 GntR family transcriptional regulator [Marinovum sp. 2_MG-2023]MDO6778926.1 GntR family transcriptional regulator [Marinovum sp. 1_MG-2023]